MKLAREWKNYGKMSPNEMVGQMKMEKAGMKKKMHNRIYSKRIAKMRSR